MSDIRKLSNLCKNSVSLSINRHRDYYQDVLSYLFDGASIPSKGWQKENGVDLTDDMLKHYDISKEELNMMIELDVIVELQVYPRTANGFFTVVHHDVDLAIKNAIGEIDS